MPEISIARLGFLVFFLNTPEFGCHLRCFTEISGSHFFSMISCCHGVKIRALLRGTRDADALPMLSRKNPAHGSGLWTGWIV